jgi:hypothetical protein
MGVRGRRGPTIVRPCQAIPTSEVDVRFPETRPLGLFSSGISPMVSMTCR